jgi:hypothetical protein
VVNPQTNQVKNKETGNNECPNDKRSHQPVEKRALRRHAPVHFERLFVNRRAVLIFDPSFVSLAPLLPDNLKRAVGVVGFGFDYPMSWDDPAGKNDPGLKGESGS